MFSPSNENVIRWSLLISSAVPSLIIYFFICSNNYGTLLPAIYSCRFMLSLDNILPHLSIYNKVIWKPKYIRTLSLIFSMILILHCFESFLQSSTEKFIVSVILLLFSCVFTIISVALTYLCHRNQSLPNSLLISEKNFRNTLVLILNLFVIAT